MLTKEKQMIWDILKTPPKKPMTWEDEWVEKMSDYIRARIDKEILDTINNQRTTINKVTSKLSNGNR